MEQTNDTVNMLELMDRAAFCVKDGTITATNDAARKYGIADGQSITELLLTGAQEYAAFTGGCLYLTLKIAEVPHEASVTQVNGYHLFRLEQEEVRQDLQVMALAAQELRQPLANIMAVADRLFPMESEDADPELQDQLSRINRGLYQMLRIVSNMSDGYRYCLDQNPSMQIHNVSAAIRECVNKAAPLIEHTGLKLQFSELADDVFCLANTEKIERAISNLLSNALKFAPKESTIDICLRREKHMLYLTVKNGSDGTKTQRSDIANHHHRRPGIEDSRFGIGLGMVLIRSAAAAHGGTVLMEQSSENGTKVTLTMEIKQTADTVVRNYPLHVDYAGERDHLLLEFSESLPSELYKK